MANIRMRFPNFKLKAFTLSYDDGVAADVRLVKLFEQYGVKGTFNLNSTWLRNSVEVYKNQEVAVHGYKHLSLSGLDSGIIVNEIITDRKHLEAMFGRVMKGMAYANGAYDEHAKTCLKACGISYARTIDNTGDFSLPEDWLEWHPTCHHADSRLMEYADKFLLEKERIETHGQFPLLFYVWGHSYEFDDQNNWGMIENFLRKISGQEDVWYATNGEIYQYTEDFKRLQFSADATHVYNPSVQDIYFLANGIENIAKAGKTSPIQTVRMQKN